MTQPPPDNTLSYASTAHGIREIAKRQRILLLCILACILCYAFLIIEQKQLPLLALLPVFLVYVAAAITSTVFVFLLATKLYGTGLGIVLGILTLIPCIGLIVLLIVNGKATTALQQNGIKVGLLGAKLPDHLR